jgi:hypothetical protein
MSSAQPVPLAADEIWSDVRWLAQAIDPVAGLLRVVEIAPEDYRYSSFLDDRILEPGRNSHLLRWSDVERAQPRDARSDARWIFHIGHVGSTLISRLLGELESVLAVREPRALRDLTFFPREVRSESIPTLRALMSRTFSAHQTAVVKATSMVSQIAGELVGEGGRALFLFATPRVYIQTILAGDQSPTELQTLASYYSARAQDRGIWMGGVSEGPAHVAALVWACEMVALEEAADTLPDGSILWRDFDAFLETPTASLSEIAGFFGFEAGKDAVADIAGGPLMQRYSKALEHQFGPDTRRRLLSETAAEHSTAIEAALALLSEAAEKSPLLARALHRSKLDR